MKKEDQNTENEQLRQTPVISIPLMRSLEAKNKKYLNYQKMKLIKNQIFTNSDQLKLKEKENDKLWSDYKSLQNENQELAEKIDYAFLAAN